MCCLSRSTKADATPVTPVTNACLASGSVKSNDKVNDLEHEMNSLLSQYQPMDSAAGEIHLGN
jgi:hypothetical protein